MRTAFWKNTDRRPAWPSARCHHSIGARIVAYQKRPGGSRTEGAGRAPPDRPPRPSPAPRRRPPARRRGSAGRRAAAAPRHQHRHRHRHRHRRQEGPRTRRTGGRGPRSAPPAGARATSPPADRPRWPRPGPATARRTAVTSAAVPSPRPEGSCASLPSRVRRARPVWVRARSRTPGPAGRSASGTLSDRSAWLAPWAARRSGPAQGHRGLRRAAPRTARRPAPRGRPAPGTTAGRAREEQRLGRDEEGHARGRPEQPVAERTGVVRRGRTAGCRAGAGPGAAPAGRGPPTAEKASVKPTTSMPSTALHVRTDRQVPTATSAQHTGSRRAMNAARCRPVPGILDSPPRATTVNSAYVAATGRSKP